MQALQTLYIQVLKLHPLKNANVLSAESLAASITATANRSRTSCWYCLYNLYGCGKYVVAVNCAVKQREKKTAKVTVNVNAIILGHQMGWEDFLFNPSWTGLPDLP